METIAGARKRIGKTSSIACMFCRWDNPLVAVGLGIMSLR
jgi:hypothetical protein